MIAGLFRILATQLRSIREPCKIVELIFFPLCNPEDYENSREHCRMIDEALISDNFPSLRSVQLTKSIPFDYFPTLQLRNLLYVYRI